MRASYRRGYFHTDMLHFPMFEDVAERTITTLHGRLDLKDLPEVYRGWTAYPLVSVSDDQRKPIPFANWIGTVHHGTRSEQYTFHLRSEGYLAFLGRISPEKRPDRAIEIARRCGKRLKIAAKVDAADRAFWSEVIEPMIRAEPLVEFIGEIGDADKSAFLGGADALFFHRLARTFRACDDRGHGLRHAGHRIRVRFGPRGCRARPNRLHRRGHGRSDGGPAPGLIAYHPVIMERRLSKLESCPDKGLDER